MAKVYEFLATGFEEVEALVPVDVLRRGGVEVVTVSIIGDEIVTSSHGVGIRTDARIEDLANLDDADMLIIPGGMPGSTNLRDNEAVRSALKKQAEQGKRVGAICAAPLVLASIGVLKGKKATIYPGMEDQLINGAEYTGAIVQEAGNITTGAGPMAVIPYAYKLLSYFVSAEEVEKVKEAMLYNKVFG